jgi:hypothetical protein
MMWVGATNPSIFGTGSPLENLNMAGSLAPELERLIDIEDIRQLKARFGLLMDSLCQSHEDFMATEFGELFTEDATMDSAAFGHFAGRAQIQNLFSVAVPSQMRAMWHTIQSPIIELNGDRASGRWTMMARVYPVSAAPSAPPVVAFGRYTDEYRRVEGRWRIAKMYFENSQLDSSTLESTARGTNQAMAGKRTG